MTNGEKMQAVFPDIEMWGESKDTLDYSLGGMIHRVTKSFWNAEYKEPTTKNNCAEQNGCITCSLDDGDDCCRKLYEESMQEPTTKNNSDVDCISRKQAIDAFPDLLPNMGYNKKTITEILQELPPITPQERKGHWITNKAGRHLSYCSECGEIGVDYYNYCPTCGADMKINGVEKMKFEIGKTYQHTTGKRMTIIGRLKTHTWGECLVGEDGAGELHPVGENEENALNWYEVEE